MKQETHGRFTPGAWYIIKSAQLSDKQHDRLRLMIEAKTHTITKDEAQAILYTVMRNDAT